MAFIEYRNARFVARIYGDELDFLFIRDDFTLPFDQILGPVSFSFRETDYTRGGLTGRPALMKTTPLRKANLQVIHLIHREPGVIKPVDFEQASGF